MSQEIKDATPVVAEAVEEVKKAAPESVVEPVAAEENGKAENGESKKENGSSDETPSSTEEKSEESQSKSSEASSDESQKTNGSNNTQNGVDSEASTVIVPSTDSEESTDDKGVKRKSDIEPVEVAVGKKQKVEDTETESSTESATA